MARPRPLATKAALLAPYAVGPDAVAPAATATAAARDVSAPEADRPKATPRPAPSLFRARVELDPEGQDRVRARVVEHDSGEPVSEIRVRIPRAQPKHTDTLARAVDMALAAPITAAASPVLVGIALAIRLEDGGPVFFKQRRAGLNGEPFEMLKFRSMSVNADALKAELLAQNEAEGGVIFKMRRDPRVTRVGRFIRRYSLDELPQILNVLRGDMSLVGPRPHPVEEAATYPPEARSRLKVKPGITCLWQVMGRSLIPFHEQMKLDDLYIRARSLRLDLRILARTAGAVLSGRGAF